MQQSGNRGSDNIQQKTDRPAESATMPKQSARTFVPPQTGAVKKSISIKEELSDPVIKVKEKFEETTKSEKSDTVESVIQMDFSSHWLKMADLFFEKIPTVYYTIKEFIPEIIDNVVYIKVKNDLQREQIEIKIRDMLIYLRDSFNKEINNIEILVDDSLQSKVRIFDEQEKLRLLQEQNNSMVEFLKILNLTHK